jgi:murein DD-endopeptidase MepM/ murein hydrolase activator NlpD
MFFRIDQNGLDIPVRSFSTNGDGFTLLAGYTKNKKDLKLTHTYRIINRKYNIFYDLKTELSLTPKDIEDTETKGKSPKPFSFPFNKIIGVTQWYGFTDYQSPHTGIDFGATKENVVSVADGEVVGKGWDGFYNECLSGGNFLKIKHSNGMHTTYFHLEDMYVNTGELVKKGQIIGRSGNTGAWNCQKLAYHLHLETRLNSSYKSHTNPVPYIDVDWNKIPTLGAQYNPGRISGENPHPGR